VSFLGGVFADLDGVSMIGVSGAASRFIVDAMPSALALSDSIATALARCIPLISSLSLTTVPANAVRPLEVAVCTDLMDSMHSATDPTRPRMSAMSASDFVSASTSELLSASSSARSTPIISVAACPPPPPPPPPSRVFLWRMLV